MVKAISRISVPGLSLALLWGLGIASRGADSVVTFNEIMYHPSDDGAPEWIELHNQMSVDVDLSGWRLAGAVDYTFPDGTVVASGGQLVVASESNAILNALGPFTGKLDNAGELLELFNNSDRLMDAVRYDEEGDWPAAPDGSGVTLSKRNPHSASAEPRHWTASSRIGGSPGAPNSPETIEFLCINEMSAVSEAPYWIELKNLTDSAVDLNGMVVSVSADPEREMVLSNQALLPPDGYRVIELALPVRDGDRLFLYDTDRLSVIDAQVASNSLRGRAESGEWKGQWLFPQEASPGEMNPFQIEDGIVINELMYHHRPEPAIRAANVPTQVENIFEFDQLWHYNQSGADLGSQWAAAAHPDWEVGRGPLGFDTSPLDEPINHELIWPPLNDPFVVTYYFETEFALSETQFEQLQSLEMVHFVDDGAAFFINGVEIPGSRFCLPEGPVSASTFATCDEDARAVGPVIIAKELLTSGTNRLSVQVHQGREGSSDVVFGARLSARLAQVDAERSQPYREVEEEWIELYNRSQRAIDISGWKLEKGVSFEFRQGTVIDPGGYLVIARDAEGMALKFPDVVFQGDFTRRLNNGSDLVRLRDANGNPADAVRYFDGGRWPSAADGGGSSLELRDPEADNASPEAWKASDETGQSEWKTFRYRGSGEAFPGSAEPSQYHEFIFGLLDSGEFLIDDISVIEDPDGVARELIQDGEFNGSLFSDRPTTWRLLGTHGLHGRSVIVDDPLGTGKVLHVVVTGGMWHLHDHAETTLKHAGALARISASKQYEISFRARWLSGCPLLNTRLYFNRLSQTHILPQPKTSGSPGRRNSVFEDNIGPTFSGLAHSPISPEADTPVEVRISIDDPHGVDSATLHWSGGQAPLERTSTGEWMASIPGAAAGDVVAFYVEAIDGDGAGSTFPADGAESRALIRWRRANDRPSDVIENLTIILTDEDAAILRQDVNQMTNHRQRGTVVYGDEVFYDVGVRLKGSQRGRPDVSRRGFSVRFHADKKFRGVHDSIGLDRSGGWRFGRTYGQDEILIWHFLNRAGGIPALQNDLVNLMAPGVSDGSAQLHLARYTNDFLDDQFENGADGSLHNYELIYYPTTTSGGVEGLKRPNPDNVLGVPLRDLGDNPEAYRYHFQLRNKRTRDDYTGMMRTAELFSLRGEAFTAELPRRIDVSQWLRAYAGVALAAVNDSYFNNSNAHNARFYHRPSDGRMLLFPWDLDFAFTLEATSPLVVNSELRRIIAEPKYEREFYGHVLDIVNRSFNEAYMSRWIDHYEERLTRQSLGALKSFIGTRAAHAVRLAESAIPRTDFALTTEDHVSESSPAIVEGVAWVDVREIRLAGSPMALEVEWLDETSWRASIPLGAGTNEITLEAVGYDCRLIALDSARVTNASSSIAAAAGNLVLSEMMYNPAPLTEAELSAGITDKEVFEFLEFLNTSRSTLDLASVRFQDGIDFLFPQGTTLPAGERLVVVPDKTVFQTRYAASLDGIHVVDGYAGRLSNGGERLHVLAANGSTILDMTYADDAPWPSNSDGDGYSLTLIAPDRRETPDSNAPENWRSSPGIHGTPGSDDRLRYADWKTAHGLEDEGGDPDDDGKANLWEYACGTDPSVVDGKNPVALYREDGRLLLSVRQMIGRDDVDFSFQYSEDLVVWSDIALALHGSTNLGNGERDVQFDVEENVSVGGYFRVTVRLRE